MTATKTIWFHDERCIIKCSARWTRKVLRGYYINNKVGTIVFSAKFRLSPPYWIPTKRSWHSPNANISRKLIYVLEWRWLNVKSRGQNKILPINQKYRVVSDCTKWTNEKHCNLSNVSSGNAYFTSFSPTLNVLRYPTLWDHCQAYNAFRHQASTSWVFPLYRGQWKWHGQTFVQRLPLNVIAIYDISMTYPQTVCPYTKLAFTVPSLGQK